MRSTVFVLLLCTLFWPSAARGDEQPYELAWRYVTGGRVVAKPAVDHRGTIYVLSDDRTLYAVSALGRERWRYPVGRKLAAGPVIVYDGTILIGTSSGILLAAAPNGRLRWMFSPRSGACLSPALAADGSIILPTAGGTIYGLSYTGEERWRYQVRAELASSPSIGRDGTIFVGTTDRRLLALNRDGSKKWELELPARVGTPAIDREGNLYVSAAGVHRISPEGILVWSYGIPADTADPVIRSDGAIIAGAGNGRLYAISPEGRQIWSSSLRFPIPFPAVIGQDGTAYVSTASTEIAAVSSGGLVLWRFRAKQAAGIPTIGREGMVIVGAEDWILYALKTASTGLSGGPWPQVRPLRF